MATRTCRSRPRRRRTIYAAYSSSKNIQGWQPGAFSYPFANINNLAYISGPSFDPQVLAGQTWSNIADGLSDPTNPATQAIVTTANYMSASICNATKGQPGQRVHELGCRGGGQGPRHQRQLTGRRRRS